MRTRPLAAMATLATLAACTGDPEPTDTAPPGDGPLYLLHSAVETADGRLNYFSVVEDPAEQTTLTYEGSIEIPGRPRLYAAEGIGLFAIGDAEDLTVTRYDIDAAGALRPGAALSFQAHGLTSMGPQAVLFVDDDTAYYKDASQGQVIVWNPSEMVIERAIPLPEDVFVDDHVMSTSDWVLVGDQAFFAIGWTSYDYDRVLPGVKLVRVDTTTDEVTVTDDDRCRGLATARVVGGTAYFFSDIINGFGHAVYPDDGGQQDCILRITPGSTGFDASWVGSMSAALPDGTAGVAMDLTPEGEIWAQVVDLSTAPSEAGATYSEWYAADWTWWHLPVDTLDGAVQATSEPGAYTGFTLAAEGGFFVSLTAPDYSETTLLDISGSEPRPGLSFPGFVLDMAPIR